MNKSRMVQFTAALNQEEPDCKAAGAVIVEEAADKGEVSEMFKGILAAALREDWAALEIEVHKVRAVFRLIAVKYNWDSQWILGERDTWGDYYGGGPFKMHGPVLGHPQDYKG